MPQGAPRRFRAENLGAGGAAALNGPSRDFRGRWWRRHRRWVSARPTLVYRGLCCASCESGRSRADESERGRTRVCRCVRRQARNSRGGHAPANEAHGSHLPSHRAHNTVTSCGNRGPGNLHQTKLFPVRSVIRAAVVAVVVSACAGFLSAAGAQQTGADAGTPVLFIGYDEDPNALIRSNRIFEWVFAGLHREMASRGYDVIDEAIAADDLGRTISDRRSRAEIVEFIRALHESDDASQGMQAAVLVAIRIWHRTGSTVSRIRMGFEVEIYDPAGRRRLIAFRFPADSSGNDPLVFPAPRECGFDCVMAIVADHVDDVCADLALLVARELDRNLLSP